MKNLLVCLSLLLSLSSCQFFFGEKSDDTIKEIFIQGSIDPNLIPAGVGYVPVQPFFTGYSNPVDVCAGYDEMIYVVDDFGLHVLDQAGRRFRTISIPGAKEVAQDRRLHTYVSGRLDITVGGNSYNVAAVYRLSNTATADGPYFIDTLIQPFDDLSRAFTSFRGAPDVAVQFNGLTVLHDNTLMIGRTGPTNSNTGVAFPDNTVLFYDEDGNNLGNSNGLTSNSPSIKSSYKIQGMNGFAGPPQRLFGINTSRDFFLAQYDSINPVEFACLGIEYQFDPDLGVRYDGKPAYLNFDTTKATRFLYESYRFGRIADICVAADNTEFLVVIDQEKDSLYQFTNQGFEGVTPPANFPASKLIITSFGGEGSGLFNFRAPSGIAYMKRIVYVADKGNGRICRYVLSTDIE